MKIIFSICFFVFSFLCKAENFSYAAKGSHSFSCRIFDGREVKDLELVVKFETNKKDIRILKSLLLVIEGKKVGVPDAIFNDDLRVSFDSIKVGENQEENNKHYFVQITNMLENGSVENLVFQFNNSSFLKLSKYNSKTSKKITLPEGR